MNAITRSDARSNRTVDATLQDGPLAAGAQEPAVKVVERMLRLAGFSPGVVDNKFTASTAEALRQFQSAVGLPSTGSLDTRTFDRLKKVQGRIRAQGDQYVGIGQKSDRIRTDEQRLRKLGYDVGRVDGIYDADTARAVRAFRADQPELHNKTATGMRRHGAEAVLAREARALDHAPEHRRSKITRAHRRLDAATAAAAGRDNPDGTTGVGVGNHGRATKNIQAHLKAAGYDPQHTNGVFDERTAAAVKAFQRRSHLPVSGRVDAQTWNKLSGSIQAKSAPMTVGERSHDVLRAERALQELGFKPGKVDGLFDSRTLAAAKKFEHKHHGHGRDGSIDARELKAMERAADGGKGQDALRIAKSVLGRNAGDIKYHGPLARDMNDWVPNNVNCANFVSAVLEKAGMITNGQHHDAVRGLRDNLRRDRDWKEQRTLAGAKPGDVVMFHTSHSWGHVVMFAGWDSHHRPLFIGSNNVNADGSQRVTMGHSNYRIDGVFHFRG
ncbi:MAG: peptidoglycan-binding protein [Deltaproteobacteria bacterium]|nr:peptidoglycan-binding protein [Deltaproteobacteria bacterium]